MNVELPSATLVESITKNMPGAFPPVNGWELLGGGMEPAPSVEMIATVDPSQSIDDRP